MCVWVCFLHGHLHRGHSSKDKTTCVGIGTDCGGGDKQQRRRDVHLYRKRPSAVLRELVGVCQVEPAACGFVHAKLKVFEPSHRLIQI